MLTGVPKRLFCVIPISVIVCIVYLGLSALPSGDELESAPSAPYILNSSHVIRSPINRIMQGIRQGFPLKLCFDVRLLSQLLHLLWAVLDCINVFAALSGRFGGFFLPGAPNGLLQILMQQK